MARGFVTGVLWGVVVMGAGLTVLSLVTPPPVSVGTAPVAVAVAEAAEKASPMAAADKVAAEKAAAEKVAAEKVAADKVAAERAAADKVAADKVAAEKAAAEKVAAEKVAAERVAADKAAAEKVAAEKVAAEKAAAERAAAERAAAEKAAAERAAAERVAADKAAAERVAAEKVAAEKVAAEAAAAQAEQAAADSAARHKAATEASPAESTPAPFAAAPEVAGESPAILTASDALPAPDAPVVKEDVPALSGLDQALSVPAPEPAPAPDQAAPRLPEGPQDALLVPEQPAGQEEQQGLPRIAPVAEPDLAPDLAPEPPVMAAEPSPDATPRTSPAATIRDDQPTVKPLQDKLPTTVLDKNVPGVKVAGLPQVGAAPEVEPAVAADLPPVQRFARAFAPEGKPLFVILLHDVGAAGMARAELAKLAFPVSFVIDPLATDARAASAVFRAAGQEVLTLANGIPPGAKASDLEVTFQTLSAILPESVAILDQDLGGFQDQRPLATLALTVIKGEGRGLVTYDRGLNAADQIARREGVPAAVIFRRLDGEGESKSTIRHYLDRAAFKAAQEGAVVVIGDTSAATVAAIVEWTIKGRAATVTLAPVTAVLGR